MNARLKCCLAIAALLVATSATSAVADPVFEGHPKLRWAYAMNPQPALLRIDDMFARHGVTIADLTTDGHLSVSLEWLLARSVEDAGCLLEHEGSHLADCDITRPPREREMCALKIERACCDRLGCSAIRKNFLATVEHDGGGWVAAGR